MTARHARTLAWLAATSPLAFLPHVANAQTRKTNVSTSAEETDVGDEIVVTATKRGQTVQDAPISVSVLGEELIERSGATNFSEIADLIPSVVFSQSQSPIQSNVGIRGVSTTGGSAALEPSVGIYIDGVFTDRTAIGIGDFNDIARVEVLRGPQGTQFGNSSPAGIINFVTKRPEKAFSGEAEATYGSFNRLQFSGSLTGSVVADSLSFRISAFSHIRDGYLKNLSGTDRNDQDSWGLRAKLLFEPTNWLEALLTYEHGETDQICCSPVTDNIGAATLARFTTASTEFPFRGTGIPFPDNQLEDQVISINGDQRYRNKINAYQLDVTIDLGDADFTSVTAYRTFNSIEQVDLDFSPINLLYFPESTRKQKQLSQEFRVSSTGKRRLTYLAGLYFFRKDVVENSMQGVVINPTLATVFGNFVAATTPLGSDITNKNYAAFGEATFEITENLRVTGGLRYNHDDKNITAFASRLRVTGAPLSPTQTIPAAFQNRSGGRLTGKAIVQYDFTPDIGGYASYTRGYKAFGINDDANLLRNVPGASFFFDSEKVDNYEIGLKTYFPAQRASVNLVLFNTKYDDFQSLSSFTDSNNMLRFFLQNAASLTSRGAELDVSWRPSDRFQVQSSISYVDAKFDSFPNAQGPAGIIDLSGGRLRDAPKLSASLTSQYTQPLGGRLEAFIRGDVFYRSKVFTNQNLDPLEVQKGYAKINARIGIGDNNSRWSAELFVRNLTDKIVFNRAGVPLFGALNALLPAAGIPPFPTGNARIRFVGEPRTYGATVRLGF